MAWKLMIMIQLTDKIDTEPKYASLFLLLFHFNFLEEFEDTKEVIRIRTRRKTDNTIVKRKRTKGQSTIYKTLHIKLRLIL